MDTGNQSYDVESEACSEITGGRIPIKSLCVSNSEESGVSSNSMTVESIVVSLDDSPSAGQSLCSVATPSSPVGTGRVYVLGDVTESKINEDLHAPTSINSIHQMDIEHEHELSNQRSHWKARHGSKIITRTEIIDLRRALDEAESEVVRLEVILKELLLRRAHIQLRRTAFTELKEAYKAREVAEEKYEEFLPKFLHPLDVEEFDARSRAEF